MSFKKLTSLLPHASCVDKNNMNKRHLSVGRVKRNSSCTFLQVVFFAKSMVFGRLFLQIQGCSTWFPFWAC